MDNINRLLGKKDRLLVGLMSGTSVDGIDASLVRIKGDGLETDVELICFDNYPYDSSIPVVMGKISI